MKSLCQKLSLVACLLVGCDEGPQQENLQSLELQYLSSVVPEALLEYSHLEIAAREAVRINDEAGKQSLELSLSPEHGRKNRGNRAEVSVDFPFTQGETVRYEWQFMLPNEFPSDAPRNRWWLIAQWHDQPDRVHGETWDDHPERSPSVALSIGEDNETKELVLALNYGTGTVRNFGPVPLKRGVWHNVAVMVTWSTTDTGRVAMYLDDMDKALLTAEGANMHNRFQHYLKLGMYRHPEIMSRNSIHIRQLSIATTEKP